MSRETNQIDAGDAGLRTGMKVGGAGHAEGSYLESASNLVPVHRVEEKKQEHLGFTHLH